MTQLTTTLPGRTIATPMAIVLGTAALLLFFFRPIGAGSLAVLASHGGNVYTATAVSPFVIDGSRTWLFDAVGVVLLACSGVAAAVVAWRRGHTSAQTTALIVIPSSAALIAVAGSLVVFCRYADLLSFWA